MNPTVWATELGVRGGEVEVSVVAEGGAGKVWTGTGCASGAVQRMAESGRRQRGRWPRAHFPEEA